MEITVEVTESDIQRMSYICAKCRKKILDNIYRMDINGEPKPYHYLCLTASLARLLKKVKLVRCVGKQRIHHSLSN
jgi:DNA-directed RNA polymerase subunit RPC12/RpoP